MKKYFLAALILIASSCTPFDSNEYNKKLIQGEWHQVELASFTNDNKLLIETNMQEAAILRFVGDSCFEGFEDLQDVKRFTFQIKDYFIKFEEAQVSSSMRINKLIDDSLILESKDGRVLRYLREK